jgi:hypothetical protein
VEIRKALGLSPTPLESTTVNVGPVLLTKAEANQFARFDAMKDGSKDLLTELLGDTNVISYSFSGHIFDPEIYIWKDNREQSSRLDNITSKLSTAGFRVTVQEMPFSKGNYLAARNASSRELFGFDINVDINPRVQQKLTLTKADEAAAIEITEMIKQLRSQGIKVFDTYLPGEKPVIELVVDERHIELVNSKIPKTLAGMVFAVSGGASLQTQAAGPWTGLGAAWSGRLANESVARGGKRFTVNGVSCSSGPVIRSQYNQDFVVSAGHCANSILSGSADASGTSVSLFASCNVSQNPNCSPNTYGGVDASVWTANAATGWFVHQGPGSGGNQGTAYTDNTVGSSDLSAGDELICIEGASPAKYNSGINAISSCGTAVGWSGSGFYRLNMYQGNAICQGDSGGYVRKPTGFSGSWNAGHFRAIDSENPQPSFLGGTSIGNGCHMRSGLSANYYLFALVTTFWKTHVWLNSSTGHSAWAKTW